MPFEVTAERFWFEEGVEFYWGKEQPWRLQGACRQPAVDPGIFFSNNPGDIRKAKRICDGCPAKDKCRQYALDNNIPNGTFGGLAEGERRTILKGLKLVS